MSYEFCIDVVDENGKPGLCNKGCYISRKYESFKDVYRGLVNFDAENNWRHLQAGHGMFIRRNGGVWINSMREGRYKIWLCDLQSLDLTQREFEAVMIELDKEETENRRKLEKYDSEIRNYGFMLGRFH